MEFSNVFEIISIIFRTYGFIIGLLFFLNFLAFIFLFFFWKKRFENIADEISAKTIKSFETRQSLSISDLELRKELLLRLIIKSENQRREPARSASGGEKQKSTNNI